MARHEGDPNAPASQPWVAIAVDELIEGAVGPQPPVEPPRPKPQPPPAPTYSRYSALPVVLFVIAAAVFVVQASIRSALAEAWMGDSSMASLERAVVAAPELSLAWQRLGLRQSRDGGSESAIPSLQRAVELAPGDSSPQIALALELERAGRLEEAERALLEAAASEAGFRPRWNLANYYARHGSWDQVWRWTKESIVADPSQLPTAASLGWRAEAEPETILNLAIPDEPEINRRYFAYLHDLGQTDAMRQAWPRFEASITASEVDLATQFVDRLIAAGFVDEAVAVWNFLCNRALLPYASIGGPEQRFLTNPFFLSDPSGRGFDWTAHDHRGVLWTRPPVQGDRGVMEFRFSGAQESGIVLLSQVVPTAPGSYTLGFDLATQGMEIRSGLGWVVRDPYTGDIILPFETLSNAEGFWDEREQTFVVPQGTRAVALELHFQEIESKERRISGFALSAVELSLAEAREETAE